MANLTGIDRIVSDSEPEGEVTRVSLRTEASASRSSRRRTSDERPGLSTDEGGGREVLVLSSASESEVEVSATTSSYFAKAQNKRRKRLSPPIAADDWSYSGFAGVVRRSQETSSGKASATALCSRLYSSASTEPPHDVKAGPERSLTRLSAASDTSGSTDPSAMPSLSANASSSSFVSARQLLADGRDPLAAPSDDDDEQLVPPILLGTLTRKSSTRSKAEPLRKRRSTTAESRSVIEIVEPVTQLATGEASPLRRRRVRRTSSAKAESIASNRSSGSDVEHDDVSSTQGASGEEAGQPCSSERRKPWEALEAQAISRSAATKRAPTPRLRARQSAKVSAEDKDAWVCEEDRKSPEAGLSSSTTASSARPRQVKAFLSPPVSLPSDERIRLLTSCPLPMCTTRWPASLSARQNHLRSCANKLDLAASTVSDLTDEQIVALADAADEARRATDDSRTLFDVAIGRGQGGSAKSDVSVVGVEGFAGGDPREWHRATQDVQDELDRARRKAGRHKDGKLRRIAKEIRRERADAAVRGEQLGWAVSESDTTQQSAGQWEDLALPAPTGRIRAETSTARRAVAQRASELLGSVQVCRIASSTDSDGDEIVSLDQADVDDFAFDATPPRPTQVLEPTFFSTGSDPDSSIEVLVQRAKPSSVVAVTATSGAAEGRSREPFRGLLLQDPFSNSEFSEGRTQQCDQRRGNSSTRDSLWRAAAGRDDALLQVVMEESPATSSATDAMKTLGLLSPQLPRLGDLEDKSPYHYASSPDHSDDLVLVGGADHFGESSEEEPLASVVRRRLPSSPRGTRRKSASDTPSSPSSAADPRVPNDHDAMACATTSAPGVPDYSKLSLAALKREVAKYGFRPSKERSVLERQLAEVWHALHPDGAPAGSDGAALDVVPAPKPQRGRKKKQAAAPPELTGVDEQDGVEVTGADETVGEKLRRLILADQALYLRILRYEPIHFDEFVALAVQGGVKVAKPLLVRFLDEQSITFYTQDPTSGPRRRH